MATQSRLRVLRTILEQGLVPLFHHDDPETARNALDAVAAAGGRVLEFTNRGEQAHEVFGALVRHARAHHPDFALGVGTVRDAGTAALYLNIGADFVVGPTLEPDVARLCNRWRVPYLPGCATPTEISQAEELGADIVKVFPGDGVGGPEFVKAVLGPSPRSLLLPTGGVSPTESSLRSWFEAGAAAVGIGSKLFPADALAAGDWDTLTTRVRDTLTMTTELALNGRKAL